MIKLTEYAKKFDITYRTAWERFRKGKIKNAFKDEFGKIYILEDKDNISFKESAIYCRVSCSKQKNDLKRQAERVRMFAVNNGFIIKECVKEIGSGVNDNRKKLINLLKKQTWNTLIVEHADRLTRFGFNYLKLLLEMNNKKIIVINQAEDEKIDLMQDMISILYSFSARMYGKRNSSKKKAQKALEQLKCD